MGIQDQRPSMESKSCQDQNLSTIKKLLEFDSILYKCRQFKEQKNRTLSFIHVSKTGNHIYIYITDIPPKNASLPVDD